MRIIDTSQTSLGDLPQPYRDWVYNGLDCCVTYEVYEAMRPMLDSRPLAKQVYERELAQRAPLLEMMLRGLRVNEQKRLELEMEWGRHKQRLRHILWRYLTEAFPDFDCTEKFAGSTKQLQAFFYDYLGLPTQYKFEKGKRRPSCDRDALEKLQLYFIAEPVVKILLALREAEKFIQVLRKGVDHDGRIRTSYNQTTETGRLSSSENAFGTGDNLQNWTDAARIILVADPGMKLCYADLEQAESRAVAYISGDEAYIEACESGDLHTTVCCLVWPELPWTGKSSDKKAVAGKLFYRHFTFRDMAKRGGHGCLTPDHEVLTRSGWTKISEKPTEIMGYVGGSCRWVTPSHWEDKEWQGTLVHLRGTSLSADLTSDHRVVFVRDSKSQKLTEEPAIAFSSKGLIPLGQGFSGTWHEPLAELVAAFQCDGYQKTANRVEFHFHKKRKFARLELLANRHGIPYERRGDKAYLHWNCPYPKDAGAYLLEWDNQSLTEYYTEHAVWDGAIGKTNATTISSVNREHLEWLQTVGRLIGYGGNFNKPTRSGFGSIVHRLQQNNRRFATKACIDVSYSEYDGRVLCPTVPGGAFLIRHQGKISVTGNTNYYGTPGTMARHLKVASAVMEEFQRKYFSAFPGIPAWHRRVSSALTTSGRLTTAMGRERQFFGRARDDATLRKAIAFDPQSLVADILNEAMYRVWRDGHPETQLLAQLHDAILFQYPEELEDEVLAHNLPLMDIPVTVSGRVLRIPVEAAVGWTWSHSGPDGIKEWTGNDTRTRTTPAGEKASVLDIRF